MPVNVHLKMQHCRYSLSALFVIVSVATRNRFACNCAIENAILLILTHGYVDNSIHVDKEACDAWYNGKHKIINTFCFNSII